MAVSLGQIVAELEVKLIVGKVLEKISIDAVATPHVLETLTVIIPGVFII